MINKVIFEKLKEILKETSDNSVSYGCANPRAITSKDMEVFKMALATFRDLLKSYKSKVFNREEDRKFLREVCSLLIQFNNNINKMLNKNFQRFKMQKDLNIKEPLKIFESFSKAVEDEEYTCKRFELVSSNGKKSSLAYLLGDASSIEFIEDDGHLTEREFKILINKLKYNQKSYMFYSECDFINFWPFFTHHFNGTNNIWYEQCDDELGKVIDNFTNLAISDGYDIEGIAKSDMTEAIKVRKPDLGPTELELRYLLESPKEGLMDELIKSFLNHGFKINNMVNKENKDVYYDTPDMSLMRSESVLRLRSIKSVDGERYIGTYKKPLKSEGAYHKRLEYNMSLDNPTFENLQNALSEQVEFSNKFEPSLNITTERNDIYLEKDGITYALSIDNVEYVGERGTYQEVMVEVELKTKDKEGHLLDIIHDFLSRDVKGLILIKEGKYQRGVRYTSSKVKDLKLIPNV